MARPSLGRDRHFVVSAIGFGHPAEPRASDNVETAEGKPRSRVVVHAAEGLIPSQQAFEPAFVSPEVRPGVLVIKVTNDAGKVVNTIFFPFERFIMVQQIEEDA